MFVYSGAVAGLSVAAASMANSLELFATVRSTVQVYLSFFSTQFYPTGNMPSFVAALSNFNPMTWALLIFRELPGRFNGALQSGSISVAQFVYLGALSVVLMFVGFLLYRRTMEY
jgi:ABC-type polysaccharide/polyol phosphate export permease